MGTIRVPVELNWGGGGSPGVNVWHLREDTVPGDADQGIIDAVRAFYQAFMNGADGSQGYVDPSLVATLGQCVDVEDETVRSYDWTTVTSHSSDSLLPPSNQLCVSWRTSIAAARGHGRTFLGPLALAARAPDGTPAATFLTHARACVQGLVDASTASTGSSLGIYGYEEKGGPDRVFRDITAGAIRDKFAVLRSRRD